MPDEYAETSDEALMDLVLKGNEEAFTTLVIRYHKLVFAFVYRLIGNRNEAEDLTQDVFLRVWERARTWKRKKSSFKSWLMQVAHNLSIDQFRKEKLRLNHVEYVDGRASSEDDHERKEEQRLMRRALDTLPWRQKTAIILCNIEGWTQKEAGEVLGCTDEAIEALIGRGRRSLKQHFHELLKQ